MKKTLIILRRLGSTLIDGKPGPQIRQILQENQTSSHFDEGKAKCIELFVFEVQRLSEAFRSSPIFVSHNLSLQEWASLAGLRKGMRVSALQRWMLLSRPVFRGVLTDLKNRDLILVSTTKDGEKAVKILLVSPKGADVLKSASNGFTSAISTYDGIGYRRRASKVLRPVSRRPRIVLESQLVSLSVLL